MRGSEYILFTFAFVLVVCVSEGSVIEDDNVLKRLAALETFKRESVEAREAHQREVQTLRDTLADQRRVIDKQSQQLRAQKRNLLEVETSQRRLVKRLHRVERLTQTLMKADWCEGDGNKIPAKRDNSNRTAGGDKAGTRQGIQRHATPSVYDSYDVLRRQTPDIVAFTAYLDHDVDLRAQQVIIFNQIITNEGNGYNNNTGVFTCVRSGIYQFYFSIGQRDENELYASLKVNSRNTLDTVVEGFHPKQDLQGGNLVVIRITQGDSVWVESIEAYDHTEGSDTLRVTSFTGVLLYS